MEPLSIVRKEHIIYMCSRNGLSSRCIFWCRRLRNSMSNFNQIRLYVGDFLPSWPLSYWVLLSLDIHLVQVVARQPLLNSRLKKNKKDADVADSNSRVERSTLGYITGLSKPWMLFSQNLRGIVSLFRIFLVCIPRCEYQTKAIVGFLFWFHRMIENVQFI